MRPFSGWRACARRRSCTTSPIGGSLPPRADSADQRHSFVPEFHHAHPLSPRRRPLRDAHPPGWIPLHRRPRSPAPDRSRLPAPPRRVANVYVPSPDQRIRLGFLPEGEDDARWKIAVHSDPFAPPHGIATFDNPTPTELVTAFATALAHDYAPGSDAYLYGNTKQDVGLHPLIQAGWKTKKRPCLSAAHAPDGLAVVNHIHGPVDHQAELAGHQVRWGDWGGNRGYCSRWYANFTPLPT
ncbi:DUF317 domain-containing protein [Streptomyces sp. NPDC050315]|uniref:DUF317 domain-containing protein n=1 Tax=Streptomyces sp. NPDC050315 TaxID=3155039 RepID=UPI00341DBF46